MYIIRQGTTDEIEHFQLFNENNEGDEIVVAELNGEVIGFAQYSGAYIYFVESNHKGAGRALVEYIIDDVGGNWFQACNVCPESAGFWTKLGFVRGDATGERLGEYHYELGV